MNPPVPEEAKCQLNSIELVELARLLKDKWHPFTGRALELKTKSGMPWSYFGKHMPKEYYTPVNPKTAEEHIAFSQAGELTLKHRLETGHSMRETAQALKKYLDPFRARFIHMYQCRTKKS